MTLSDLEWKQGFQRYGASSRLSATAELLALNPAPGLFKARDVISRLRAFSRRILVSVVSVGRPCITHMTRWLTTRVPGRTGSANVMFRLLILTDSCFRTHTRLSIMNARRVLFRHGCQRSIHFQIANKTFSMKASPWLFSCKFCAESTWLNQPYCCVKVMDLRIGNFRSNRISNRIGGWSFTASMLNFCW